MSASHDVTDRAHVADPTPERRPTRGGGPVGRAASAVYRFLYSKKAGLAIILALAFLTLMGTLISQAPAGVRQDPAAYADWLADARYRYGGWTPVLDALGFFSMYSSVWFVTVGVLLGLSITACTTHRIPLLWRRAAHPNTYVSNRFFDHAQNRADLVSSVPPDEALATVAAELRRDRFRVVPAPRSPETNLYADKWRWGPFGTAVAHTGMVVILAGMLVTALASSSQLMDITVGTRQPVPGEDGIELEVLSFSDTYNLNGTPLDYVSDVILYDNGVEQTRQEVRVNTPIHYRGLRIHQTTFGIATVVDVTRPDGTVIYDDGVPMRWTSNDGNYSIGTIPLPELGYNVVVSTPASGRMTSDLAPGELAVVVYPVQSQTAVGMAKLSPGGSATIEQMTFTYERETRYTGLTAARNPGTAWIWAGSALLVLGMYATFGLRHRRVWVRVNPADDGSHILIGSVEKFDPIYQSWFRRFVGRLEATTNATATTSWAEEADHA